MRIGVSLAFSQTTPVDYIAGAAQRVEAAGFHSLWVPEHVLFFPDYASRYPYAEDGRLAGNPQGLLDPFSALTFIAAHTRTLRLGTGICLVPQRQPVYTAKLVADLDYLSGGRVDFGIGIGWLAEEFAALGVPFSERAARCDDYIGAMKALWTQPVARYQGRFVDIPPAYFNPKPVQKPHPPILVGGESDAALKRVAALGDGWYGFDLTPETLAERLVKLDGLLAAAGRQRSDIQVFVSPNRHRLTADMVAAFGDAGVDQIIAPAFARNLDELDQRLARLAAYL
ncbi:MAG: LLM class F420-dependent oxidoreductase [Gammaproteobacteria bacterium]|jgi:probable F420-dependent oxidoreductase